jgi:hypothetical protein
MFTSGLVPENDSAASELMGSTVDDPEIAIVPETGADDPPVAPLLLVLSLLLLHAPATSARATVAAATPTSFRILIIQILPVAGTRPPSDEPKLCPFHVHPLSRR